MGRTTNETKEKREREGKTSQARRLAPRLRISWPENLIVPGMSRLWPKEKGMAGARTNHRGGSGNPLREKSQKQLGMTING